MNKFTLVFSMFVTTPRLINSLAFFNCIIHEGKNISKENSSHKKNPKKKKKKKKKKKNKTKKQTALSSRTPVTMESQQV